MPGPDYKAGAFSSWAGEDESRLGASVEKGLSMPPDQAARVLRLQDKTGLTPDVVTRNLDEVERRAKMQDFDPQQFHAGSPSLSSWLGEDPAHAAAAQDDLPSLNYLERQLLHISSQFRAGKRTTELSDIGTAAILGKATPEQRARQAELEVQQEKEWKLGITGFWEGIPGAVSNQLPIMYSTIKSQAAGALAGGAAGAAVGAGAALVGGQLGPQVAAPEEVVTVPAAALAMGGKGAFAGWRYGAGVGAAKMEASLAYLDYEKIKDENGNQLDRNAALGAALTVGAVNGALEMVGFESIMKAVPGMRGLQRGGVKTLLKNPTTRGMFIQYAKRVGEAMGTEGVTEGMQSLVTAIGGKLAAMAQDGRMQSMPTTAILGELFDEQTLAQAVAEAKAGAQAGGGMAAGGSVASVPGDVRQIKQARATAQAFREIGTKVSETKLFQNVPEKTQQLLQRMVEGGGDSQHVYAPVEAWNAYWTERGVDPGDVAEEVMGSRDAYLEAQQTGADLEIPTARYAVTLAPTEHNNFWADELRSRPGEMNGREAVEAMKKADAETNAAPESFDPMGPEAVGERVRQVMMAAGVQPDVAEANAQQYAAVYRANAALLQPGETAMDLFMSNPLKVQVEGVDTSFDFQGFEADLAAERAAMEAGYDEEGQKALVAAGGITPLHDAVRKLGNLSVEKAKALGMRGEFTDMSHVFGGDLSPDQAALSIMDAYPEVALLTGVTDMNSLIDGLRKERLAREQYIYDHGEGKGLKRKDGERALERLQRRLDKGRLDQSMDIGGGRAEAQVHMAVAQRFGLPVESVREIATLNPEDLVARYKASVEVPNNTEAPTQMERYPLGSVSMLDFGGDYANRYIEFLREFDPAELTTSEAEQGIKKHPTYARYLEWSKQGIEPPYISVAETDKGTLVSSNRRRTLVAQELGTPIKGWFGPHNKETNLPLKYGDVRAALGQTARAADRQPGEKGPAYIKRSFWDAATPEQKAEDYLIDPTAGVMSERAWELARTSPPAGRPMAFHVSLAGQKLVNDTWGHAAGDNFLELAGQTLAAAMEQVGLPREVYKVGADFEGFVKDQAQLDQILAAAQALLPEKANLDGTVVTAKPFLFSGMATDRWDQSREAHNEWKKQEEAAGRRLPRTDAENKPTIPAGFQVFEGEQVKNAPRGPMAVPESLRAQVVELVQNQSDAAFERIYLDPQSHMMTYEAKLRLPAKAHQASADLDGLKKVNESFGHASGNKLLAVFDATALMAEHDSGVDIDLFHKSGDEYLSQSDDVAGHVRFWQGVEQECLKKMLVFNVAGSATNAIMEMEGLTFSVGLGGSDAEAEARLKGNKELRSEERAGILGRVSERRGDGGGAAGGDQAGSRRANLPRWSGVQAGNDGLGAVPAAAGRTRQDFQSVSKKAGERLLQSPTGMQGQQRRVQFYSRLIQTIDQKLPASATVDQVRGAVRDLPAEEKKWLGLDDFLKDKSKVNKAALLEHLRGNMLQVQVVKKADSRNDLRDQLDQNLVALSEAGYDVEGSYWGFKAYPVTSVDRVETKAEDLPSEVQALIQERGDLYKRLEEVEGSGRPKFASYKLPGGSNYREQLYTLPVQSKFQVLINDAWQSFDTREAALAAAEATGYDLISNPGFFREVYPNDQAVPFRSGHWDEANVLAHDRLEDREIPLAVLAETMPDLAARLNAEGKKTARALHVIEMQSDWHQKGRAKGYKGDAGAKVGKLPPGFTVRVFTEEDADLYKAAFQGAAGTWALFDDTDELVINLGEQENEAAATAAAIEAGSDAGALEGLGGSSDAVPDAPFRKTWHEYLLKNVLIEAASNGYDLVTWDTGTTHADRYSLDKHVGKVEYAEGMLRAWGPNGGDIVIRERVTEEQLPDYIGKEAAQKLLEQPYVNGVRQLEGLQLRVGGEGMRGFYDKIVPDYLRKFGKKFNAAVGETRLVDSKQDKLEAPELRPISDSDWEGFQGAEEFEDGSRPVLGDVKVRVNGAVRPALLVAGRYGVSVVDMEGEHEWHREWRSKVPNASHAVVRIHKLFENGNFAGFGDSLEGAPLEFVGSDQEVPVHAFDLSPALRDTAQREGFALWQDPSKGKGPRGAYTPSERLIQLFQKADRTSLAHESWHDFWELRASLVGRLMSQDPATLTAAQQRAVADMDAVLKRFKVERFEDLTNDHKEQLAKWAEQYLFEGKAPSEALRPVMQQFRAWFVSVYKTVQRLLATGPGQVELDAEMRGILDRMVATQEEIDKAAGEQGLAPIEGLDDPEYLRDLDMVREQAETELVTKAMAQQAREQEAWWKEERQKRIDAAVRKHGMEKVYQTLSFLQHGKAPDGGPLPEGVEPFKISKASLDERGWTWRLSKVRPYVYQAEGGVPVETVAEYFGWPSADEMIASMEESRPLGRVAREEADASMKAEHGDMLIDGSMAEKAREAVHNDKRAQMQRREWDLMATKAKATMKGLTRLMVRKPPSSEAVREDARRMVGRQMVKDIRPDRYLQAETKARREAGDLFTKGDFEGALSAKNREMLNHELYREALAAREAVDKMLVYARTLGKTSTRERIGKAGGDYLEQIDAILDRFEFRRSASLPEMEQNRQALGKFLEKLAAQGEELEVPEYVINELYKRHYKELPFDELVGVRDTLKQLEHTARQQNKLLKNERMRDLDVALEEATSSIEANSKGEIPREIETRLPQSEGKRALTGFLAEHRKIASLLRKLDGFKDGGIMWELVMRPLNNAGNAEAVANEKATMRLKELFSAYASGDVTKMYRKEFVKGAGVSISKMGRLMVALNWGNEDSRQKVLDGQGWSQAQAQAVLDTLDERDVKFVNEVWSFIDEFWPETEAMAKRVKGIAPPKVEASPFRAKGGVFRGGYFPLKYDDRQSQRAFTHRAEEAAKRALGGSSAFSSTKHGHRKARVEGVKMPVRLDFGVIFEHVAEVIHDQTHYETLVDLNKLLGSRRLQDAIYKNYGDQVYKQIKAAVDDVAAGHVPAMGAMEKSMGYLRQGTTIAGLGWNLMTTAMQPLGLTQSMVRIGPKWVARGLTRWLGDASRMENTAAWINEKSDLMRLRGKTQMREINEIRNSLRLRGKLSAVEDSYFHFIAKAQQLVDIPTWAGAYEKAMEEGGQDPDVADMPLEKQEARAVALADQAVLDSQGGGQTKDLAGVQRGGPLKQLFTNFYSFFNTTYNLASESVERTEFKDPASVGRLAVDMLLLYVAPAMLGLALRDALKGSSDDDDWWKRYTMEQLNYLLSSLVLVREAGSAALGAFGYTGPAGTRAFSEIGKLGRQIGQGEVDEAMVRSLNNVAGILFHYPAGQVDRTIRGLMAVSEGKGGPMAPFFGPPPKQ